MQSGNDILAILAKENDDYGKRVLSALFELGLLPKFKGFGCVLAAILIYRQDPSQSFSKDIYPAVSQVQKSNVSPAQVERNIRSVIQSAWKKRNEAVWAKFFLDSPFVDTRKPTNIEFISRIAWCIEFWGANPGDGMKNADDITHLK